MLLLDMTRDGQQNIVKFGDDGCSNIPYDNDDNRYHPEQQKNVVTKCLARTLTDVVARKKGQTIDVSPKRKEVLSEDYPKAVIAQT